MVKTTCDYCNKDIEQKLSQIKKYKHHFCNRICHYKWQETITGENHGHWSRIKIKCSYCGEEIYRPPSEIKRHQKQFCNMSCMAKWRKQNLFGDKNPRWNSKLILCDYCGKKNFTRQSIIHDNKHHFCNSSCFYKWKKENAPIGKNSPNWKAIEKKCDFCGKKIFVAPRFIKKCKLHFCNKACFDNWERIYKPRGEKSSIWKGGFFPYYGINWCNRKKEILKRADYISEISGKNGGLLDAHHVVPIRLFVQKYIDLCLDCIPSIKLQSFRVLPYESFIPNIIFDEANSEKNLICMTRSEHIKFEGMPPTFFDEIRRLNAEERPNVA